MNESDIFSQDTFFNYLTLHYITLCHFTSHYTYVKYVTLLELHL